MRSLILPPVAAVAGAAIGFGIARISGFAISPKDVFGAGGCVAVAAAVAAIPFLLSWRLDQAAIAQAALLSTVIHLLVAIVVGWLYRMIVGGGFGGSYLYWLLGLYWLTLIVLAVVCVRLVRSAPAAPVQGR